jgi:serine protease Do
MKLFMKRRKIMSKGLKCLAATLAIMTAAAVGIPSSYAQNRVLQFFSSDNSSGAYLGIWMADVTKENMSEYKLDSPQGVIVESVAKDSPAESADLKEKDVILEFDGFKVRSTIQLSRLVKETPVGREVEVLISRDGKRKNITVRLGKRSEQSAEGRSFVVPAPLGERNNRDFHFRIPDNAPFGGPEALRDGTPRLGITILALTDQLGIYFDVPGQRGVLVTSVREGSPSAGKLQAGDVIIRADGKTVNDPAGLRVIVQRATKDTISFDVIRDKKEIKVVVDFPGDTGKEGGKSKEYKL